jgi:hypothetical protein
MPVPLSALPSLADYLGQLEARILELEGPNSPKPAYACLKANLPDAASFINCFAYVTDTKITVASDGTVWRRQDTGAAI